MKGQSKSMTLNMHDVRVVAFHVVVALVQYVLIGLNVEKPEWSPVIQTALELLRRFVAGK